MFKITRRQYDIIMQQAQGCFPHETGGILGGRDETILGVLPIYNKQVENTKETYGITSDDILRAGRFLKKYNLDYLGLYHTHPKGIAFPSAKDLTHGQRFLFIVSLRDRYNPELRAYEVRGQKLFLIPIQVVDDKGFSVLNINADHPLLSENATLHEMRYLRQMIQDIMDGKIEYPTLHPVWEASNFSTFA